MSLPSVAPEVVVADFETELVVLVPERRRAHHLDPLWAVVFDSCRERGPADRLVREIAEATGWDAEVTARWVDEALDALRESGVVV